MPPDYAKVFGSKSVPFRWLTTQIKPKKTPFVGTLPFPSSQGRILGMDDDEAIRKMLYVMLTTIGYNMTPAKNGEEAIEQYTEAMKSGEPFDAVILDLTIPGGMGGKETIKPLLEIDPGVKAIVSSGYANDPIMADYKESGFSGVVVKPYNIDEMEKTLDNLLGEM